MSGQILADLLKQVNSKLITNVPPRKSDAISAEQFIQNNWQNSRFVRENNILQEILSGNIPDFLRTLVPIQIDKLTYFVMPDYLSIGDNQYFIRMPTNPYTAQTIANAFGCTLITEKMVDDIWKQSTYKLPPLPWGPPYDSTMMSSFRYKEHSARIDQRLDKLNINKLSFVAGHKKDVVLTNRLTPNNPNKRVAIYGWHQANGKPIQGLNPVSHEDTYADYSHGIRLASRMAFWENQQIDLQDIFTDPAKAYLVSKEGVLKFLHY